jgi:hypothetical protein
VGAAGAAEGPEGVRPLPEGVQLSLSLALSLSLSLAGCVCRSLGLLNVSDVGRSVEGSGRTR